MAEPRYTDEEAREILRRALASDQAAQEGLHHQDLIDAAAEVGISPEAMTRAADELRMEQAALTVLDERTRGRRSRWWSSLLTFATVNGFLFALDTLTPGGPWYYWPLLIWGFFVALGGLRAYLPKGEDERRRLLQKEIGRIRAHEAREARRRAKQARRHGRKGVEREIETAIEEGVAALLAAAARGLSAATTVLDGPPIGGSRGRRSESEFQRYVAGRSGTAPARSSADFQAGPPRSRVPAEERGGAAAPEETVEEQGAPAARDTRHRR